MKRGSIGLYATLLVEIHVINSRQLVIPNSVHNSKHVNNSF